MKRIINPRQEGYVFIGIG